MNLSKDQIAAISWGIKALGEKRADYKKARDYYDGNHPLAFVTDKFKSSFGPKLEAMKINLCPTVIDIPANRLIVTGFSAKMASKIGNADAERSQLLSDLAREIWEMNRMDSRAPGVSRESFKTGDSYVIVWPKEQSDGTLNPVIYPQLAGTCAVESDPENPGYIIRACKYWVKGKRVHLNIYTAKSIEKYVSVAERVDLPLFAGDFEPFTVIDDDGAVEAWPLPNPFDKCPVFHFPNGDERKSELSEAYQPQNGLNLTLCNLIVAMEFFAYPQRYVLGFDPKYDDPDGKGIGEWKAAMNRIWFHTDTDVQMGQFDASDPSSYLNILREFRAIISEVTGLPPYYFSMTGAIPSGVALQIIEKRLSDKINNRQAAWGNVWADIMLLALKMTGAVADAEGVRMGTNWKDTAPKDAQGEANTQKTKQETGISRRQSLREQGYADSRIDEMFIERANEAAPVPATAPAPAL